MLISTASSRRGAYDVHFASSPETRVQFGFGEIPTDGVAQPALTFGSPYYYGALVGGEALVSIPDNAAIRLRATSSSSCDLSMFDGGVGRRAFLTVMKIN